MEPHVAYAKGRNSVWMEMGPDSCRLTGEARKWWFLGRRDAKAELKLDMDTEWDGEAA